MAKKSLYLFLSALLGIMLFLLIDRVVVLLLIFLINGGYMTTALSPEQFLAIDYIILSVILMLGAWYGIWLGLYWYEMVYERQSHKGLLHHVVKNYLVNRRPEPGGRMEEVRRRIETDLLQLEDLTETLPHVITSPEPIKRKIVRKRVPKIKV